MTVPSTATTRVLAAIRDYRESNLSDVGLAELVTDSMAPEYDRAQAEVERLKALTQTCICDPHPATTDGPQADCPVHGAIRGLYEAQAEIERLTREREEARTSRDSYRQDRDRWHDEAQRHWIRAERAEAENSRLREADAR